VETEVDENMDATGAALYKYALSYIVTAKEWVFTQVRSLILSQLQSGNSSATNPSPSK